LEDDLREKMRRLDEKLSTFPHLNPYSPFWKCFGQLMMFIGVLIDEVLKMLDLGKDLTDRELWIDFKTRIQVIKTFLDYDVVESRLHIKL
jgi:hypothetical protein